MSFFKSSKISVWQDRYHSSLRLAFRESRKYQGLKGLDRQRLKSPGWTMLAVSRQARLLWGELICDQLARAFCGGADGGSHSEKIRFVTIVERSCIRESSDKIGQDDLAVMKRKLIAGLKGLSYIGMIEPGFYVNVGPGGNYSGKNCISWHLHALVWGISRKSLRLRFEQLMVKASFVGIADGLKAMHAKTVKQGELPGTVAYMLKSPSRGYRIGQIDRRDRLGNPIVDEFGEVQRKFIQKSAELRHGELITVFHAMKQLYLDELTVAGGEGRPLRAQARRAAMSKEPIATVRLGRRRRRLFGS